jgi:hypothetical protein
MMLEWSFGEDSSVSEDNAFKRDATASNKPIDGEGKDADSASGKTLTDASEVSATLTSTESKAGQALSTLIKNMLGVVSGRDAGTIETEMKRLAAELATYRHAFESTAADRDRLSLELENYRHAFETTAADRDRTNEELNKCHLSLEAATGGSLSGHLREEFETYKSAFEGTAIDRNRWKSEAEAFMNGVGALLRSFPADRLGTQPAVSTAARLVAASKISSPGLRQNLEGRSSTRVPNVFCVGAPKSGTSFLYSVLREHPSIAVCDKDLGTLDDLIFSNAEAAEESRANGVCDYLNQMKNGCAGRPILCEFEVDFFVHERAAAFIRDHINPDARILIFLRNPVDRAFAHYLMNVRTFNFRRGQFVEVESFFDALDLEAERATDIFYRKRSAYAAMGRYFERVSPFIEAFGPERVKVMIYEEEITRGAESTILDVFAFLGILDVDAVRIAGVDHSHFAEISRRPEQIEVRAETVAGNSLIGAAVMSVPAEDIVRLEVKSDVAMQLDLAIEKPSATQIAAALSLGDLHRTRLSLDDKRQVFDRYFRADVAKLETLIDRDLSCWRM